MTDHHEMIAGEPGSPGTVKGRHAPDKRLRRTLERVVRLTARQFDAPVVLISLAYRGRQALLAESGSAAHDTDRHLGFCAKVCRRNDILVIPDILEDERFRDSPLMKSDPRIRFCAGTPLKSEEGQCLGSLCLLDTRPRKPLTEEETELLADLAEIAACPIKMRNTAEAGIPPSEEDNRLRVSVQQLCLLMEYTPASIAMFNRDMEYLAATRQWRETFRLGGTKFFGRSHVEVVPWLPERWTADYRRCLQGEALWWEDDYFERPDGSADWLRRKMHPWFDAEGNVGGIIIFVEVTTEQKRAADELERSGRFLDAVLQNVRDGIVACDAEGRLSVFNPAAQRMHGVGSCRKGLSLDKWSHYSCHYETDGKTPIGMERMPLFRALHGEVVEGKEIAIIPAGKAPRRVLVSAQPLVIKSGTHIGAVASLHDITERTEIEARYRHAQKMEAIGQLTGGLAHDFNNLLAVIIGNLQLLQRAEHDDPKSARRLESAISAAQRGAELTDRLLAFARKQSLEEKPLDANTLIAGLIDLLSRWLSEKITVSADLQDRLWTICVDDNQLEAAILNLAINARDAMEEGGHLTIGTANVSLDEKASRRLELSPGDYVRISISDTGSGMPEEVRSRAFEPFFTTKAVGKGSGLGLSIVYGFVTQSGGRVELDSGEGRGTTVTIYFPRSLKTAGARHDEAGQERGVRPGTERILLVEDDAAVRDTAVALLADLGYRTTEAASGEAALEMLRTRGCEFDLLLTDVVMPGRLNGPALAKAARKIDPKLKVLFASGYSGAAVPGDDSVDAGLIRKPFRREELGRKVREVLERRSGGKQRS